MRILEGVFDSLPSSPTRLLTRDDIAQMTSPRGVPEAPEGVPCVDLVCPWVDGDDPQLHTDMRRYASDPGHLNPERTRDLYELLRYSLRSVEMFAGWVRNVHIITRRPQVPSWLDLDNPRVNVVHHDELDGFAPYLPTFNSTAIESFVHAVPDVSEHFLFLNDDFLFGAPVVPGDFLTPEGKHRVYGTYFGIWLPFRIYRKRWKLFSSVHIEHCPRFVYKQFWEEMLQANRKALHRTRGSRFRVGSDLRMDRLYRMWMLGPKRRHSQAVKARELLRYHRFHRIDNDVAGQTAALEALTEMRPKFYCLNDDQGEQPNAEVCAGVRAFLEAYYPDPSEFERQEGS
jgi:hypothetical protein